MPAETRRRSLLVATSEYKDPEFHQLRAPGGDARALAKVLGAPDIGGFEIEPLAVNETCQEIKGRIDTFFHTAQGNDFLLLYISGHGVLESNGKLYFAGSDTIRSRPRSTAIDASWLDEVIDESLARQVVLLLDCCHSGAFPANLIPKGGEEIDYGHRFGGGKVTLTASDRLEYAFEQGRSVDRGEHEPGSLFTQLLVEGLRTGAADEQPMDGEIHIEELHAYIRRRIKETTRYQTPGLKGDLRGDPIFIARNPNAPETVLPPEIVNALGSAQVPIRVGATQALGEMARGRDRLAKAAEQRLRQLSQDDSQRVSAAARSALGLEGHGPPSPAPSPPPQERHFQYETAAAEATRRPESEDSSDARRRPATPSRAWKAEFTERRWTVCVVRIQLSQETHHVKVKIGWLDSVELDGVTIWKEKVTGSETLGGPYELQLSDGDDVHPGTLTVHTNMNLRIRGIDLTVGNETLLKE